MSNFLYREASPRLMSVITTVAFLAFLPLLLLAMYQSVQLITRATGIPANITVNTKVLLEPIDTEFYHAFAQGGEEAEDMISPVGDLVKQLKPRLIRLDHIYDHYDVVHKDGGAVSMNWSNLDKAVDAILAVGAVPFLSLSYMPTSVSRDGTLISPPADWNDWVRIVQQTVEHYSGRSQKNISGVYYEVWNEPDLAIFGAWKRSGDKNYLDLYRYAAIGAGQANNVNAFHLGGPSTTGLYQSWILDLLKSGNRIDFYSWHSYLADPTQYVRDQENLMNWLKPYPRNVVKPTIITEFGFTGDKSSLYGTTYAAAYTAAVIRQMISGRPAYIFSFQLKDGPSQEAGNGWGLITHQSNGSKPKPRFYVYPFIDTMAGRRLELRGEGSWVTSFATVRDGTVRVLLVNFDRNGTHTEETPVTFTSLSPGTYTYSERFLFGRTATMQETVAGDTLQKKVYLPVQSIAILELAKNQ